MVDVEKRGLVMMTLVAAMTVMMMKQRGDGVKRIVVVCQRLMRYMCSN